MNQKLDVNLIDRHLKALAQSKETIKTGIVYPCSADSLVGALEAGRERIIDPVLIGPKKRILKLAENSGFNIESLEIIDIESEAEASLKAVQMAAQGDVEALMKGSLHTDELMKEVVKSANGLKTPRRISHVFVLADENYHKPFVITDAAINIAPDLATKRDIVQNAVDFLCAISEFPTTPKVAVLAAVEVVNPAMNSTIDAACLCKMADRGQIKGCIIDGPLAFDNAISKNAAQIKGIVSSVAGDADILLTPDLESGNMLAKQLALLGNASIAGVVLGAKVPIMLTSRADNVESRVGSCMLAVLLAHAKRENRLNYTKAV